MDTTDEYFLLMVLAFVVLGAIVVFALLESSLARMSRVDIKLLLERKKGLADDRLVSRLTRGKSRLLVPLQMLVHLLLVIFALLVFSLLEQVSAPVSPFISSFVVVGVLLLALQHWLPWMIVRDNPEKVFLRLVFLFRPFFYVLYPACYPVFTILDGRQNGDQESDDEDDEISDEEVQAYLDVGEEEGIFEQEESRMIQQVMEFGDTIVREIMMPRTEVVAVADTATREELKNLIVQTRHSRIPVFHETIDSIVGVAYVRHLLAQYTPENMSDTIQDIIMPAFFIPETKKVLDLLREMQTRSEHMAIVVDEYGGVAGLVTMEDLLEEIVGEIRDEDQPEEVGIQDEGENGFVMDGDTDLDDIEQQIGVDLYEEGYNTIAGVIIKQLGRFPAPDEVLTLKGLEIHVLEVDHRKIQRVRVKKIDA